MWDMPTERQLIYQRRANQLREIAQGAMRKHNRFDRVTLDEGTLQMVPDPADHKLRIPTGSANVDVFIPALWFREPTVYRSEIETAVDGAFKAG
jgi:hypothetical protein